MSLKNFDVPFPVTGTGMTNSNPIFGNGNGNENSIKFHSLFREREWEWKIPFPTFGTGIGGRYSREFPGSGIPAHGCSKSMFPKFPEIANYFAICIFHQRSRLKT